MVSNVINFEQSDKNFIKISASKPLERRKKINILVGCTPFPEEKISCPEADILILFEAKKSPKKFSKHTFLINSPGEYEIQSIFIQGISVETKLDDNIVFVLNIASSAICLLGNRQYKEFSPSLLEKIGPIDVLVVCLDGQKLDPSIKQAISRINPCLVIFWSSEIEEKKINSVLDNIDIKTGEPEREISFDKQEVKENKKEFLILKRKY